MWKYKPIVLKDEIVLGGVEKFNTKHTMLNNILSKIPEIPNRDQKGHKFDARDVYNISMLLDFEGKSEQEFEQEVLDLASTFVEGNDDKKKKYLDIIYDKYDKLISYKENGVNTEEEFVEVSALAQMAQTIVTLRDANPEYYFNRYNTQEKQKQILTSIMLNDVLCGDLAYFRGNVPDYLLDEGISSGYYNGENFNTLRSITDAMVKSVRDKSNTITIDITDEIVQEASMPVDEVSKGAFIGGIFQTHGSVKTMLTHETNEIGIGSLMNCKYMFLNGENLEILAKKALMSETDQNPTPGDIVAKATSMYYQALVKGDKAISIAMPVFENGKSKITMMDIKPNVKDIEAIESQKHSAFRLKYFNWGPFKIRPNQKSVDKLYNNKKYQEKALKDATKMHMNDIKSLNEKYANRSQEEKDALMNKRNEKATKFLQDMLNKSINKNKDNSLNEINTSQKVVINEINKSGQEVGKN